MKFARHFVHVPLGQRSCPGSMTGRTSDYQKKTRKPEFSGKWMLMRQRENLPLKIQKIVFSFLLLLIPFAIFFSSQVWARRREVNHRVENGNLYLTQRGTIFTGITLGYICIIIDMLQEAGSKRNTGSI